MPSSLAEPKIYHITHVDNLPGIIADGGLFADSAMRDRGGPAVSIGMAELKDGRIADRPVQCHEGTMVGDYVPFYFCPRSIMLYVINQANHPKLAYRGGQGEIVHLEADLRQVYRWTRDNQQRWTVSLGNAAAKYTPFRNDWEVIRELDWNAIAATDWRDPDIKDGKQVEFLMHNFFPWTLFSRVGVLTRPVAQRARDALQGASYRPVVEIVPEWYY